MNEIELNLLRKTLEIARSARAKGNHPFGALLADKNGNILLEAENTVFTGKDITAHAELNLVREAARKYTFEELSETALYTSCEPCPMCAGAVFWANIGRVCFALSAGKLYQITGTSSERFFITAADIFANSTKSIEMSGGFLEPEAAKIHEGFVYK
jgi:tRNA(Arg) A34 adenosine deaminase TadA